MQLQDTPRPWETEPPARAGGRLAAAQAAAAVPRLGSSTHFATYQDAARAYPGPAYLVIVKGYGQNGGKVVMRTVHEQPQLTRNEPDPDLPRRNNRGKPRTEADPVNLEKSCWRARSKLEDWLRMTATPGTDYRLVTGTWRNGCPTIDQAYQAVGKLRKLIERHYPGVKVMAVPELHHGQGVNQDTYHVHMVMVFPPGQRPVYQVFHRLWYITLGGTGKERGQETPGNLDFARTHDKRGGRYTVCQAARYVSKYLTKDRLSGYIGQKRFTTSHGAPEPVKRYWWEPIGPHSLTRARMVNTLRGFFAADTYCILNRTFNDGGDTYHVFSAEPLPDPGPS